MRFKITALLPVDGIPSSLHTDLNVFKVATMLKNSPLTSTSSSLSTGSVGTAVVASSIAASASSAGGGSFGFAGLADSALGLLGAAFGSGGGFVDREPDANGFSLTGSAVACATLVCNCNDLSGKIHMFQF